MCLSSVISNQGKIEVFWAPPLVTGDHFPLPSIFQVCLRSCASAYPKQLLFPKRHSNTLAIVHPYTLWSCPGNSPDRVSGFFLQGQSLGSSLEFLKLAMMSELGSISSIRFWSGMMKGTWILIIPGKFPYVTKAGVKLYEGLDEESVDQGWCLDFCFETWVNDGVIFWDWKDWEAV